MTRKLPAIAAFVLAAASAVQAAGDFGLNAAALPEISSLKAQVTDAGVPVRAARSTCDKDGSYRSTEQDNDPLVWQTGAWPITGSEQWKWVMPVTFSPGDMWGVKYICSPGVVCDEFGAGKHEGLDYVPNKAAWSGGGSVLAAADGEVVYVRVGCPQTDNYGKNGVRRLCADGWGNHVVVRHGKVMMAANGVSEEMTLYSRYVHMATGGITAAIGDKVAAGQRLGRLGNSGSSNVPHLHFEVGLMKSRSFERCKPSRAMDYVVDPYKLSGFPKTFK